MNTPLGLDHEPSVALDPDRKAPPTNPTPALEATRPDSAQLSRAELPLGALPVALAASAAVLAACGGGGGAQPTGTLPSDQQAARFVAQAGFAATDALVADLKTRGYEVWLDEQMAMAPSAPAHVDWLLANGWNVDTPQNSPKFSFDGFRRTVWRQLISAPDVLRQRIVLAMSEIFVISTQGLPVNWRGFAAAAYADVLGQHCFGTFRDLLEAITLSTGMGDYLNMRGNRKADASGRQPDENYAREVMQLFSLGLYKLAADGSVIRDASGNPQYTYTQDDVVNLARVFTGWDYDTPSATDPAYLSRPMKFIASRHSTEAKEIKALGVSIPAIKTADAATGPSELKTVLDAIARHPNVAPFIGRQLIQRLVTSDPSPAYIGRVVQVFNDNGSGVRGDLKAVIKAVLLDPEARTLFANTSPGWGKLREPLLRFLQWARGFGAHTTVAAPSQLPNAEQWGIGDLSSPAAGLGMSPWSSPTVFNFFRPGYVPPNTTLSSQQLVAPEFQLANETSVLGYINFMQNAIVNGVGDVKPDYSAELPYAADATGLVNRYALLLTGNAVDAPTLAKITQAVNSLAADTDAARLIRVQTALLLVMVCPQYLVQK